MTREPVFVERMKRNVPTVIAAQLKDTGMVYCSSGQLGLESAECMIDVQLLMPSAYACTTYIYATDKQRLLSMVF